MSGVQRGTPSPEKTSKFTAESPVQAQDIWEESGRNARRLEAGELCLDFQTREKETSENYSPVCSQATSVMRQTNVGVSGLPHARPHFKHPG